MPVLLRIIIQRLLLLILSGLAFVGIQPELHIPTREEAQIATEKRKEAIQETVSGTLPHTETPSKTIPVPTSNILEQKVQIPKTKNITHPDTNKSTPPVIEPAPQTPTQPTPPIQKPVPSDPTPEPTPPQPPIIIKKPATISTKNTIENVVLNILCVRQNGNRTHVSSGSGVLISPNGLVLTNAHVAQMFLLKDIGYTCTIRRPDITTYGFTAMPVYISKEWVTANFKTITNPSPTGTGENDYALLLITGTTDATIAPPQTFPYTTINTQADVAEINDEIIVAGYPGIQTAFLETALKAPLQTDTVSIKNVFTLDRITVDVFSTTDTPVAQRGSSGGGVFKDGSLIGIIVTTNPGSVSTMQIINALTLDYINRDIQEETGKTLKQHVTLSSLEEAQQFGSSVGQHLTELLLQIL